MDICVLLTVPMELLTLGSLPSFSADVFWVYCEDEGVSASFLTSVMTPF